MSSPGPKPRVLLTNDDGPPDPNFSPFVLGLYHHLINLGWQVKVILPSSQKSWIGKAFHINDTIQGNYFYPKKDGSGDISSTPRPLKEGELGEWILLDGTPASCANIALHNLYPEEIDLVISGPNFGRNSSAAFALSSGTLGAALSSSLSKKPSIAVSYAIIHDPVSPAYIDPAHKLACRILNHLWHNWGTTTTTSGTASSAEAKVDLYSVNIPMIEDLVTAEHSFKIYWTTLWRNSYGRLFENVKPQSQIIPLPGAGATDVSQTLAAVPKSKNQETTNPPLLFKWSPDLSDLIDPTIIRPPIGSDAWALVNGSASVTPLRAAFAEPYRTEADTQGSIRELEIIVS